MSKDDKQASGGDAVSRRDILQASTGTAAIAGAAALMASASSAATQQPANNAIRTGEPQPFYDYSPITRRPKLKWPNGARVAVFIVPNVEHWDVHDDKGHMDVRNLPRNDYGLAGQGCRLMELLAGRRVHVSHRPNASGCPFYY